MVIARPQNIVDIPDTFAYVNVSRNTTGNGTAVLAAPAEFEVVYQSVGIPTT